MKEAAEWLKEVAGLFITLAIISLTLLLFGSAKNLSLHSSEKIARANQDMERFSYQKYEGMELTGSEVINAISRYQNEIPIRVCNEKSEEVYQGNFKISLNDREKATYIKPSRLYVGSLLWDKDQAVSAIVFTAKE